MDEEGHSLEVKKKSDSLSSEEFEDKRIETSRESLKKDDLETSDKRTTDDESDDLTEDLDSEETESESEITDEEVEEEAKVNYVKYVKYTAKGAVLVILFYFLMYLVIAYADKKSIAGMPVELNKTVSGLATCGANSFMLRDSVCDEIANTELCLFDGGDCCLEAKVRKHCKNCSCILTAKPEKVQEKLLKMDVKAVTSDPGDVILSWTVTVEEVISGPVCAVLCLDHKQIDQINAWHYNNKSQLCRCGWTKHTICPENLKSRKWAMNRVFNSSGDVFVALNKTIPCRCSAKDLRIDNIWTETYRAEVMKLLSTTFSPWHCQQNCQDDPDCQMFSWIYRSKNSGECQRMKGFDANKYESQANIVSWQSNAISSTRDCQSFSTYFDIFSDDQGNFRFVCPGSLNASNSGKYLVYLSGNTDLDAEVYKLGRDDSILECTNSLAGGKSLDYATGGLLGSQNGSLSFVLCSGTESGKAMLENRKCFSLGEPQPSGQLASSRLDAASLVLDDGQVLWVTGGSSRHSVFGGLGTTEFVRVLPDNSLHTTEGPHLPILVLSGHCLEKVGPNLAILIGGRSAWSDESPINSSWSFDIDKMTWTSLAQLKVARSNHICGVVRDSVAGSKKIVISAGGTIDLRDGRMTNTVELLTIGIDKNDHHSFAIIWRYGPFLPLPISNAASATTADHLKLYVMGGSIRHDIGLDSSSMFQMQCANLQCSWTKLDQELRNPSSQGIALALPFIPMASFVEDPNLYTIDIDAECHATYYDGDSRLGNSICDGINNKELCGYDGGDCCSGKDPFCFDCVRDESCACHVDGTSHCQGTCPDGGDEMCNGANNVPECNYDDGDCCLSYSSLCFMCVGHQCLCHLTGQKHCEHIGPEVV